VKINLTKLAHTDGSLYARLIRSVSVNFESEGDTRFGYFNETQLPTGVKIDLEQWLARQAAQNALPPAPTPPGSEPEPTPQPEAVEEEEPQITWEQIDAENREEICRNNVELFAKHEAEQKAAKEAAEKARIAAEQKAAADAEAARLAALPRLPNGELQLPLETIASHKYSVAQLKDLAQRQREAARSGPRTHGWHGAKL
jgi:hypothetical protein